MYRYYHKLDDMVKSSFARIQGSRRTNIYCVGTAKSGTHSISSIFDTPSVQHMKKMQKF